MYNLSSFSQTIYFTAFRMSENFKYTVHLIVTFLLLLISKRISSNNSYVKNSYFLVYFYTNLLCLNIVERFIWIINIYINTYYIRNKALWRWYSELFSEFLFTYTTTSYFLLIYEFLSFLTIVNSKNRNVFCAS